MRVYPTDIKEQVRRLRSKGKSLIEIHERLQIPKTTIRGWIKDITLTDLQREQLKISTLNALQKGRIRAQKKNKEERIKKAVKWENKGLKAFKQLSKKELLVAGVALYWAEGFKNQHERRLGFCNSDPAMVKFYIHWLEECLGVQKADLIARVSLNKSYESKIKEVEQFWADYLGISRNQFTKPFYQHSVWKKQFNTDSYKGVLRIHVKDSLEQLLQMRGWIEGLKMIK